MKNHLRRVFVTSILALVRLFCVPPQNARQNQDPLAFVRAKHLQRGINASQWFSQWAHDYSAQRLQAYTTADDIALIAALGLDHVRLSIDPLPLVEWQTHGVETTPFVTELDRAVKLILDNHLSVIIDIHPADNTYKMQLRQGQQVLHNSTISGKPLPLTTPQPTRGGSSSKS